MSNTETPTFALPGDENEKFEEGMALCLSGGGYRAMLFHAGALMRLNELGLLHQFKRVSSVSGGSITAAVLGMRWKELNWDSSSGLVKADPHSLYNLVIGPLRQMASTSVDVSSVFWGSLRPFRTISQEVSDKYNEVLFHDRTLQTLPSDGEGPRFVINATNVKTGSLFRFSKAYIADYRVGMIENPTVSLADAVTASSAFPPVLSPMKLELDPNTFKPGIPNFAVDPSLREQAVLTDGGVYDNLGLETAWKRYQTIIISDAGRKMDDDLNPADDWAFHSRRLLDLLQHQTSNLRRRQAVGAFNSQHDDHNGTYFGIQTDIDDYHLANALPCPHAKSLAVAYIPTRLTALRPVDQERIINWGYAVSDAALRCHIPACQNASPPTGFPYPMTKLG